MSKYTTEVRYICENYAGFGESQGYSEVESIIDESWDKIFDFNFPIFDESYRSVLCQKILKHYYTREIGFESVGLWKLKLNMMMNEIMPYYNKLYKSELLEFNPFYDVDLTTTHEGKNDGVNVGNDESDKSVTGKNTSTSNEFSSGGENDNREINYDENSDTMYFENSDRSHTEDRNRTSVDDKELSSIVNANEKTKGERDSVNIGQDNRDENKLDYDLYSDTPQGGLTGVNNENYLTNARKVTMNDGIKDTNINNSQAVSEENRESNSGRTELEKNKKDDIESVNTSDDDKFNKNELSVFDKKETGKSEKENYNITGRNNEADNSSNENVKSKRDNLFHNTDEYVDKVVGKRGGVSYSKLLKDFRDTFLNIDRMVILDLGDLFMRIW